ncbi:hypothetical protein H4R34_004316 [Dimargaris verticillata]|uniref:PITH domain-containing protein n=1 Tax=Dimargaris verticillata TaxID=2761393 RepID=A0A9W8B2U6_9FUNG|nr:hypothetical protein H4R34_004316 [Dimargaris verticillata]
MQEITTIHQFNAAVEKSSNQLVVFYFTAKWCPPCRVIGPYFQKLSEHFTQALFVKVDIDAAKEIARENAVASVPKFLFYKDQAKVAEVTGARLKQIEEMLRQYAGEPATPYSFSASQSPRDGGNSSLTQNAPQPPATTYGNKGHEDLTSMVLATQLGCLNESEEHPVGNILTKDTSHLESDVDEQLLIHIPFNQKVRLHSLKFEAPLGRAPKTVKVFINQPNMGFEEVESMQETQLLELTDADYADDYATPLRFVRFQNVSSITLFIADNLGDEEVTAVQRIVPVGRPIESANVSNIKQSEEGM